MNLLQVWKHNMKLKSRVSKLIGVDIEAVGWDEAFTKAQVAGHINGALIHIIQEICKELDPYIPDLVKKPTSVNEQVPIFNPLKEDFSVYLDVAGNGHPMAFTIRAQELGKFDPMVSAHIKKHLINKLIQVEGIKTPTEADIQRLDKQISAKL